jgi:hypothetical protein
MTADAKVAADFKAVWDQFKTTREKEIISAIYKGSADHAKKIADGIQSERLHCSETGRNANCRLAVGFRRLRTRRRIRLCSRSARSAISSVTQ